MAKPLNLMAAFSQYIFTSFKKKSIFRTALHNKRSKTFTFPHVPDYFATGAETISFNAYFV